MKIQLGRPFWILATAFIAVFSAFVIGRNLIHAIKIKHQIGTLQREADDYRVQIREDSTLLENLRYDDYLEEYARENFHMQRPDEQVYIIKK